MRGDRIYFAFSKLPALPKGRVYQAWTAAALVDHDGAQRDVHAERRRRRGRRPAGRRDAGRYRGGQRRTGRRKQGADDDADLRSPADLENDAPLLEPVTRATRAEAIGYAARRPYDNAFIQWVLEGGHGAVAPDGVVLSRGPAGGVRGLIYFGAQLALAADDAAALDAFATETRKHRGLRSFVGPKDAVDGLWERVRAWHPPSVHRARPPAGLRARRAST